MSEEEEKKVDKNTSNGEAKEKEESKEAPKKEDDKLNKALNEIESLKALVNDWKNKYYRAYADTDNLRKQIEKDHCDAMKYRAEGFIEKLMAPLDGFHLALSIQPKNDEMKSFLQGFEYIYNNIVEALKSEGVSEIVPKVGDKFDSRDMHALDTVEKEGPENLVTMVAGVGYRLHDRLIRPAMVYVSCKIGSKAHHEDTSKKEESTSTSTNESKEETDQKKMN